MRKSGDLITKRRNDTFANDYARQDPTVQRQQQRMINHGNQQHEAVGTATWPSISESYGNQRESQTSFLQERLRGGDQEQSESSNTLMGMEDERSTESTRLLTQNSCNPTTSRLTEIEYIIKSQQKAMEVAGRKTSERLSILERQFNRIDDLDTKMPAVQLQLENTEKQLETLATNQHRVSQDIQEI